MIDKREKIIEICDKELEEILQMFLKEPLIHFSEKDLHWLICKHIEECLEREQVVPSCGLVDTGDKPYKSILVHQEYGRVDKQKYRQDIVLLDPGDLKKTNGFKLMKNENYLTPVVSIEISTEHGQNWRPKDRAKGKEEKKEIGLVGKLNKDFESLKESKAEKGYLLVFYRVTNKIGLNRHEERYIEPLERKIRKLQEKIDTDNLKMEILCGIKYLKEHRSKTFVNGQWAE